MCRWPFVSAVNPNEIPWSAFFTCVANCIAEPFLFRQEEKHWCRKTRCVYCADCQPVKYILKVYR